MSLASNKDIFEGQTLNDVLSIPTDSGVLANDANDSKRYWEKSRTYKSSDSATLNTVPETQITIACKDYESKDNKAHQKSAKFVRITTLGMVENHPYDMTIIFEASNLSCEY